MTNDREDRSTWPIGGGVLIGLGVGFFLLPLSTLYFVGSLMIGLGFGIIASRKVGKRKHN